MSEETAPLVTVGMTTYNQPEKLKKALECIVTQTYENLEIIVSEDCTPCEETKRILDEYESHDSRIRVIHQKTNLGPPTNINFVLTQASGKYFMWADDDDLRDKDWIEKLLSKLTENKNAVVALGNVVAIDEDESPTQYCDPLEFVGPRTLRLANYFMTEEQGGKACVVCGIFETDFLQSIKPWGQYDKSYFGTDFLFVLDCIQHGDAVVDPSVTIYKRMPTRRKAVHGAWNLDAFMSRIRYQINCAMVPNRGIDKLVLLLLIPIKAAKSFFASAKGFARAWSGDQS